MGGWTQRRALPTSLPGSPAAYDTGPLIELLGERLVERSKTQHCQEVQQRIEDEIRRSKGPASLDSATGWP
jgi:hypothetical protein